MKLSWQLSSLLIFGSFVVGCSDAPESAVSDATNTAAPQEPATTAPAAPAPEIAAAPSDPLLEGIELEDPAEFAQIKSAYEAAPTDSESVQSYVGTLLNFAWVHGRNNNAELSNECLVRGGKILLKAAEDKVELPVFPESSLQAEVLYGYACVLSKSGDAAQSLDVLRRAVEVGFNNLAMLNKDEDLVAVRALPTFADQNTAWEQHFEEIKKQQEAALVERAKEDLANGKSFPFKFDLMDINGKKISLDSLKGRVCIVDIWGTWCPPCRQEVPMFVKLQEKYGKYGFNVVGLNDERGPSEEANVKKVKEFSANNSMNYPCALITEEVLAQLPDFKGFPTTLFIDHHGEVRLTAFGFHEYGYLDTVTKALLTERQIEKDRGTATN